MNIERLKENFKDLQELCVWMTGCGYDFSQHSYFKEKQHLLSLDVSIDNVSVESAIKDERIKISDLMNNVKDY